MKFPLKVYCDFKFSNGNYYYYLGHLANKADKVTDEEFDQKEA